MIVIMEETAWDLLLMQILPDTETAALVMVRGVARTFQISTSTKISGIYHDLQLLFKHLSKQI